MEFVNLTPFTALCYSMLDVKDQEYRVSVVRTDYRLVPLAGRRGEYAPVLIESDPAPLCMEDEFFGELNTSSVRYESDLAPFKPSCDVLLQATAYAPAGRAAARVPVRLSLSAGGTAPATLLDKSLVVTGERWIRARGGISRLARSALSYSTHGHLNACPWELTEPERFTSVPIRYELAFGGECRIEHRDDAVRRLEAAELLTAAQRAEHPDGINAPAAHAACGSNPIGRGFAEPWYLRASGCDRLEAPRIEYAHAPFSAEVFWRQLAANRLERDPALSPAGMGVVGRAWESRRRLAGTYDETWLTERHPYLPADFDFRYWNCAPLDQQIAYPPSDLSIELTNLTPDGRLFCRLPGHRVFMLAWFENGAPLPVRAVIDTLFIDAELKTLTCVWRALVPDALSIARLEARFESDPLAPLLKFKTPADREESILLGDH